MEANVVPWLVLVLRVPAEPSRHRVAVWRELRKIGALPLGQGAWAAPDVPAFVAGISRVGELAARGDGRLVVLQAAGRSEPDAAWLEDTFSGLREEEWVEFLADCGKFDAEIDKELALQKLTMAELEEEEQSLDRLRRWHRDLTARDVFGAPSAAAGQRLKHCQERLAEFTDLVFQGQSRHSKQRIVPVTCRSRGELNATRRTNRDAHATLEPRTDQDRRPLHE